MNEEYLVFYKDVTMNNEIKSHKVNGSKASDLQKKIGTASGVYIGDSYIRGLDILRIDKVPPVGLKASSASVAYCGKCEKGWLFRTDEQGMSYAYPCDCNSKGRENVLKYAKEWNMQDIKHDYVKA